MKHLKYEEFINESKSFPLNGLDVWKKVLEILPELKICKWILAENGIWYLDVRFNTEVGKWPVQGVAWIGSLADTSVRFYTETFSSGSKTRKEGFNIADLNYDDISFGDDIFTMDPIEIALVINKKATEKWIVNNRLKNWQDIIGKKYGI